VVDSGGTFVVTAVIVYEKTAAIRHALHVRSCFRCASCHRCAVLVRDAPLAPSRPAEGSLRDRLWARRAR
jgi:hypothetical protein